ncbi:hypothetical protein C2S51_033658 [Perilla frutescens var. frutescens]|nr:hypothetical protein C2S51_033658 [Perilla frutescens var. frutescens]
MASIGIHTAGKLLRPSLHPTNKSNQIFCPNPHLYISNNTKKNPQQFPSASIAPPQRTILSPHHQDEELTELNSDSHIKSEEFLGKIDSWVENSVTDIVNNLKQAPLLVQIYSEFDGKIKIETRKAVVDEWAEVRDEWRSGESKSPDGLIFVEELERESEEFGEGVSRAWGIVVQGKGRERGPACYLLRTDRVCAGLGLGFCTHFCLMRVKSFTDSALDQFKDSWLLQ